MCINFISIVLICFVSVADESQTPTAQEQGTEEQVESLGHDGEFDFYTPVIQAN